MNTVSDARALVAGKFPDTLFAVLGGSVVTHHRIPASGLDIVVVVEGLARSWRGRCGGTGGR